MTDSRVATVGVQVLREGQPSSLVAAVGVQVLHTMPVTYARLAVAGVQVLHSIPVFNDGYAGWGIKL